MKKQTMGILLMLLCAICLCSGQFIWKRFDGSLSFVFGLALYSIGALIMLIAYNYGSLSVLQPLNSVGYVFSTLIGNFFFGEIITVIKALGIAVIMVGIVILVGGERKKVC